MNGKKIACIVLMMIIGAVTYAAQIVHQKADAKRKEAEDALTETSTAQDALNMADVETEKLRAETDDLRRFMQAWTPYAQRMQTQSEVEEVVLASLRNANMLILSQKFEMKASGTTPVLPKSVRASLVLEDQYARTLNWLGELERRLPLARITSCRLSGGDNSAQVHAEVTMEVPLLDLNYTSPAIKAARDKAAKDKKA